jgi:hypothetical protein
MADMAYRFDGEAQAALPTSAPAEHFSQLFSRLEQTVIALGRTDSPATLERPWLAQLLERLFGLRSASRLADPRLESLRRMALILRLRPADPGATEVECFLASGYSWDHLIALGARTEGAKDDESPCRSGPGRPASGSHFRLHRLCQPGGACRVDRATVESARSTAMSRLKRCAHSPE